MRTSKSQSLLQISSKNSDKKEKQNHCYAISSHCGKNGNIHCRSLVSNYKDRIQSSKYKDRKSTKNIQTKQGSNQGIKSKNRTLCENINSQRKHNNLPIDEKGQNMQRSPQFMLSTAQPHFSQKKNGQTSLIQLPKYSANMLANAQNQSFPINTGISFNANYPQPLTFDLQNQWTHIQSLRQHNLSHYSLPSLICLPKHKIQFQILKLTLEQSLKRCFGSQRKQPLSLLKQRQQRRKSLSRSPFSKKIGSAKKKLLEQHNSQKDFNENVIDENNKNINSILKCLDQYFRLIQIDRREKEQQMQVLQDKLQKCNRKLSKYRQESERLSKELTQSLQIDQVIFLKLKLKETVRAKQVHPFQVNKNQAKNNIESQFRQCQHHLALNYSLLQDKEKVNRKLETLVADLTKQVQLLSKIKVPPSCSDKAINTQLLLAYQANTKPQNKKYHSDTSQSQMDSDNLSSINRQRQAKFQSNKRKSTNFYSNSSQKFRSRLLGQDRNSNELMILAEREKNMTEKIRQLNQTVQRYRNRCLKAEMRNRSEYLVEKIQEMLHQYNFSAKDE